MDNAGSFILGIISGRKTIRPLLAGDTHIIIQFGGEEGSDRIRPASTPEARKHNFNQ
jgi:hypothetical protein